jgi:hypothetical protein
VNYVEVCVILLVNCVIGLVVSPEEGSSLLPKRSVVLSVFIAMERDVVNAGILHKYVFVRDTKTIPIKIHVTGTPAGAKGFSSSKTSRRAMVPTQPRTESVPGFLPRVKGPVCEVYHSPSSSAKVKNMWSYTSTPNKCLRGVGRDSFSSFTLDG